MKIIELKTTEETHNGVLVKLSTTELLKTAVNNPPQGGFTPGIMRDRFRVLNALENNSNEGTLELEDADFQTAKECVNACTWGLMSKSIIEFSDQFS